MARKQWPHSLLQPWMLVGIAVLVFSTDARLKAQARSVILQRGQVLQLHLLKNVDSKTAHPGDKVPLRLNGDLIADGVTVLRKDWIVYGQVTVAHPAGNDCHQGRVQWKLQSITLANGQNVKTQFVPDDLVRDGKIGERVSLPSTCHKIRNRVRSVSETAALVPVVIVLFPLLLPMASQ